MPVSLLPYGQWILEARVSWTHLKKDGDRPRDFAAFNLPLFQRNSFTSGLTERDFQLMPCPLGIRISDLALQCGKPKNTIVGCTGLQSKETGTRFIIKPKMFVGWFVVLGLTVLDTVFQSISDRLPERRGEKREMIDERKNVQTTPTRTYCKRSRPLPYSNPN